METTVDWQSDWNIIQALLPEQWRDMARKHGIAVRDPKHTGTKITDPEIVVRAILHHACAGEPLRTTAALTSALCNVDVSAVAIHKWMRKAGPWLAEMLATLLQSNQQFSAACWAGYEIIAADGTHVAKPGSKEATVRIHTALRLCDLEMVQLAVTPAKGANNGESMRRFEMKAGQLWIFDRGYSTAPGIAHAARKGARVLVRVNPWMLPLLDAHGNEIDVLDRLYSTVKKNSKSVEWKVSVRSGDGATIAGRLIAKRLGDVEYQKSLKRLAKEYGRGIPEGAQRLARYLILFTTVSAQDLSATDLIELYWLRWQVELGIKREKSICELDKLPNFLPETIQCWIYAKLLGIELMKKLAGTSELFPPDVIKLLGTYALCPAVRLKTERDPTTGP